MQGQPQWLMCTSLCTCLVWPLTVPRLSSTWVRGGPYDIALSSSGPAEHPSYSTFLTNVSPIGTHVIFSLWPLKCIAIKRKKKKVKATRSRRRQKDRQTLPFSSSLCSLPPTVMSELHIVENVEVGNILANYLNSKKGNFEEKFFQIIFLRI